MESGESTFSSIRSAAYIALDCTGRGEREAREREEGGEPLKRDESRMSEETGQNQYTRTSTFYEHMLLAIVNFIMETQNNTRKPPRKARMHFLTSEESTTTL